ncbi:MAG: ABC transporter permease [Actinomycetota bacterium]|nr:ABC transporter permease [Actinomycetota bacterium]
MRILRSPLVAVGGAIVALLVLMAVFAPVLAPYDPRALSGASLLLPSARHLLGTNDIGQDIASQVIWGARSSLAVAVGSALLAVLIGLAVGTSAGLVGGWLDTAAMRVVDVVLALPLLPLLVLIAALAGARRSNLVLIVGLTSWPATARIVRSQTLTLRHRGFVDAARGFGGGLFHVVRRHLVPALGPLVVTGFVSVAAHAILVEAGLAFLGLADPTGVSWGLILNRALLHQGLYFTALWTWWVLPAGFAVTLAVLGFTFVGVGLEPAFNPRWRRDR